MALFTADLHNPLYCWCLSQAALYIPSMKNLELSANMARTNENVLPCPYTGLSILTMLEKIGLHLWEVMKKVIHGCMSVRQLLNSKVFLLCAGETMAMTGKSETKTVGLEAQERPGWEARNVKFAITNMGQKRTRLNPQTKDPKTKPDKLAVDEDEVVLSDWLEWESEEEEEEDIDLEEEDDKQSLQDKEDSDWSDDDDDDDDDGDSEESTESTELWESFLISHDPYNPLYFSCSTGVRAKSTDTTHNYTTLSLKVSELKKSGSADAEEHSHVERTNERAKKVCFSEEVTVHHLVAWSFASRAARDGSCWLEMARDRERFRRRVERTGEVLSPCLTAQHRDRVWDRLQRQAKPE